MRTLDMKSNPALTRGPASVMGRPRFSLWLLAVLLALVTLAVYWPATGHDFVNYDDELYVTYNPQVQAGLNWAGVRWAFCNPVANNWHPFTVLSHMLDCQMFGLDPWGHHLTSVLLHAVNTALLFLLLHRLTGATWRSVAVAALFGVHPLHVESVAWVAERKDVLSTCFGLLTLLAYSRYAQYAREQGTRNKEPGGKTSSSDKSRAGIQHPTSNAQWSYWLAVFFFALGLMSKPMLVTWPFVMVLIDYWPLCRFKQSTVNSDISRAGSQQSTIWRLVREKIPFFALALASSVVTFVVQKQTGAMEAGERIPFSDHVENALISYCRYLGKLFWPTDLAVLYPHPGYWPVSEVVLALGFLAGVSVCLFVVRARYPFLLMGWLWFLGTLVPVLGLVQVGFQAMADRYTYIPSIGVFIIVIWGANELARVQTRQLVIITATIVMAIVLCIGLTRQQLECWQDGETLFRQTIKVTENNYLAYNNLGTAFSEANLTEEGIKAFQEAIRLKPDFPEGHNNLGFSFSRMRRADEAIAQFKEAIRLKPDYTEAIFNLATAFSIKGQYDEAIRQFQAVLRLKPGYAKLAAFHSNLGAALSKNGQVEAAIREFHEAVRLEPDNPEVHFNLATELGKRSPANDPNRNANRHRSAEAQACFNLGINFGMKGQTDQAIHQFQEAIRLQPDFAEAYNNLGTALGKKDRIEDAIRQYKEAIRIQPDYAEAHNNLGRLLKIKHPHSAL